MLKLRGEENETLTSCDLNLCFFSSRTFLSILNEIHLKTPQTESHFFLFCSSNLLSSLNVSFKKANKLKLRIVGFSLNKISTHLCLLCLQARREKWGKRECKVQKVSLAQREIGDLKVGLHGIMEKVTLFKA